MESEVAVTSGREQRWRRGRRGVAASVGLCRTPARALPPSAAPPASSGPSSRGAAGDVLETAGRHLPRLDARAGGAGGEGVARQGMGRAR